MKTTSFPLLAALLLGLAHSSPAADTLSETLQKGLFEEEANHNLDAAIKAYQAVLQQTDEQRKFAATAIFRLGECYRKLGKTNEATAQYERILQEFSGETALATLSRQNLAGLGAAPKALAPRGLSKASRSEQKRLIEEEIKLAEQELQRVTELVKQNVATQASLIPHQREILELRRQLAGLDLGPDETAATTETTGQSAATDEEEKELQRMKAIIKDSPDLINARDADGGVANRTPLHKAARMGYVTVSRFLLTNGADVEALDGNSQTPLHLAAERGHKSLVELLLANKAAVDGKLNPTTPLHLAAANGHKLVVAVLLAHGANVNARTSVGWTPLHNAAVHGYRGVAEVLLENKADVNAASTTEYYATGSGLPNLLYPAGSTPLHVAASKGDAGMVDWLCSHGADVNARDKSQTTPLHHAASRGSKVLIELLLDRKADVRLKTSAGNTPLLIAARYPNADVVDLLLAQGADVNAQDEERNSPVQEAVNRKSEEVLKVLLAHGPNLEVLDKEGLTPLQKAVLNRSDRIVEMLLDAGASPNVVYEKTEGRTPLHWAAGNKSKKIAELLVAHKATINAQDTYGLTPFDLVKFQPGYRPSTADDLLKVEIGDLLRKAGASEDLQRLSFISISRKERGWSRQWLYKGTNAYNRYTLLELISNFFENRERDTQPLRFPFPDFANVNIQRLKPQGGSEEIRINVQAILASGDCSQDVPLEWGDVVEVPELDHTINESWQGLNEQVRGALRKCLERKVEIIIKGQAAKVTLRPAFFLANGIPERETIKVSEGIVLPQFRLRAVVYGSNLLRASSDVTRVTVKRKDPAPGQPQELLFNLASQTNPNTDLWLRDGDVIEVPDK